MEFFIHRLLPQPRSYHSKSIQASTKRQQRTTFYSASQLSPSSSHLAPTWSWKSKSPVRPVDVSAPSAPLCSCTDIHFYIHCSPTYRYTVYFIGVFFVGGVKSLPSCLSCVFWVPFQNSCLPLFTTNCFAFLFHFHLPLLMAHGSWLQAPFLRYCV